MRAARTFPSMEIRKTLLPQNAFLKISLNSFARAALLRTRSCAKRLHRLLRTARLVCATTSPKHALIPPGRNRLRLSRLLNANTFRQYRSEEHTSELQSPAPAKP